jgi:serine/threonine-protein phosphatase Stp1
MADQSLRLRAAALSDVGRVRSANEDSYLERPEAGLWVVADGMEAEGVSMGSTVVALLVQDGRFAVLWAGDSRIYLRRDGVLHQLTRDHTQVQDMVEAGLLSPEEAKEHPMKHVLARAVGVQPSLELDAIVDEADVGDLFLLCSDGLTGQVSDEEIVATMKARQPQAICAALVELCLERGAPDNVTTVAVACEEITRISLAPAAI